MACCPKAQQGLLVVRHSDRIQELLVHLQRVTSQLLRQDGPLYRE